MRTEFHAKQYRKKIFDDALRERVRQITAEGYTSEHDDEHNGAELAAAAAALTINEPELWPWKDGWKPQDTYRDGIRAIALIAAELERLERARNRQ